MTLLTDFGITEGEHTVMKGVIWNILPGVPIADLSHNISAQNIREAALVLERTTHYFPPETVHVVVVDPGVGTHRRPIAAQFGEQFFVGPDNGVCTPMLERAERLGQAVQIVHTNKAEYHLPNVSHIFHGRDIFAPVGAHLAKGVPLAELGKVIDDPVRYHVPEPDVRADGIDGEVMHIDHFGNLICNIRKSDLEVLRPVSVEVSGTKLPDLVHTFGDVAEGQIAALYSPTDYLMIALTNGNAAAALGTSVGEKVMIRKD